MNHTQNKTQTPPWERRLQKQIDDLRKDIGRVQQAQKGNTSNRWQKHSQDKEKSICTRQTRSKQRRHHGNI